MWGNVPRSHSRYTVARHTPSRSATSRTVSSRTGPEATGATGAGPSSKLVPPDHIREGPRGRFEEVVSIGVWCSPLKSRTGSFG